MARRPKKKGNANIRNEGADGPEAPAPSQGEEAKEIKLPEGVLSAKAETARAVEKAQAARVAERKASDARRNVETFKLSGHALGPLAFYVGTRATEAWRGVLAERAGVPYWEGDYFYITRFDRGGRGSEHVEPTVWFEAVRGSPATPVGDDNKIIF